MTNSISFQIKIEYSTHLVVVEYLLLDQLPRQAFGEGHDGFHLVDLDHLAGLVHLLLGGGGELGHQLRRGELVQDPGLELGQALKAPPTVYEHLRERRSLLPRTGTDCGKTLRIRILILEKNQIRNEVFENGPFLDSN